MPWRKKVEGFSLHSSPGVPEAPPVLSSKQGSLWEARSQGGSSPKGWGTPVFYQGSDCSGNLHIIPLSGAQQLGLLQIPGRWEKVFNLPRTRSTAQQKLPKDSNAADLKVS